MIQISGLHKSYGEQVIFDTINFSVHPGERIGLVGRNGHGKTTLFRMILGEEPPEAGEIHVPKHYAIGHLSQHLRFTEETVLQEASLSLKPNEESCDETYKVKTILHGLGFSSEDFHRDPKELSGGYQVRLNLAKVLVSEPNLLLLDEPTNYLDILSLRWLKQFLLSWKDELILITHDRAFMDSVTTHTVGIHRCKIKKISGTSLKLNEQILQEEEVYEQTRMNDEKKRKEIETFITRFRAKATKAKAVQSKIKALEKKETLEKLNTLKTLDFCFTAAPISGKWTLKVEDLAFSYHSEGPPLINRLNFMVGKKDRIAVIGKNGKGKTTLLNLLAGEMKPHNGNISGHPQLKIAYFGQTNVQRLRPDKTVEQEILDVQPESSRKAARSICGAMMFEGDLADKKISVLSGGEKSRVLLGKLLVSPANVLLLDEPTNHLDMESTESLLEAVDVFDGAVIIVTHSEMILRAIATRLIIFDQGNVSLFEGTYQNFLDRVGWEDERKDGLMNAPKAIQNNISKKEIRRIRAEIITERSRALGKLETRIAEIEKMIMHLEKEMGQKTDDLMEASTIGDGPTIQKLSKSIHDTKEKIDHLFNELELLSIEHESKSLDFDEKLN